MTKKTKINQADINTFLDAVKGVKVLSQEKIRLAKPEPRILPKRYPGSQNDEPDIEEYYFSEAGYLPSVAADKALSYKLEGVANKTLRKLEKGQYNVEAVLDLHGMSVNHAEAAVKDFLQHCFEAGVQVGLIIHGKGLANKAPILKNKLNHWLREVPEVTAFCSAAPKHGSLGAMYVMFKRTSTRRPF